MMRALAFRGQRPPAQQGIRQAVQVVRSREVRGKDRRPRDRPKEELIRQGDPDCGQGRRRSDGKHQHRASRQCDAVTTGRGRCQSARAHRGQPRPIHGAHPGQRQTEQWRAISRTRPIATVPRRKQGRRRMEARRVIEGELSNIGVRNLSNSGIKATVPSIFQREVPPPVDISFNIRYILRIRGASPPSAIHT